MAQKKHPLPKAERNRLYYLENKQAFLERSRTRRAQGLDQRDPLVERKSSIKRKYGVDWDTFETAYNKANGKCEICEKPLQLVSIKGDEVESALNDPAVMVFLRANPYADKQAMRLIYEEIASAFSGAALTCTSAADMDTGKWHLYLDVDTHGELDMDAQIQREMVLHSTFLQNQQLHRAKEYFHVTVS